MLCLFADWLKLLKLNLPELFKTLKSPHNLNSWNNDIPAFVLINGNIARTKGKENMYPIIPDGMNFVSHNKRGKEKIDPEKIFTKFKSIIN